MDECAEGTLSDLSCGVPGDRLSGLVSRTSARFGSVLMLKVFLLDERGGLVVGASTSLLETKREANRRIYRINGSEGSKKARDMQSWTWII
jgi:hypothetical protein